MKLPQPIQWQTGRAKKWINWILNGNDKRTAKDKFLESRTGIFPNKEHGFNKLDFNKI